MVVIQLDKILKPNKDTGKIEPVSLYLDGFLNVDLDFVRDRVLNHNDFFLVIIDGRPGTGKSTLGSQIACHFNQGTTIKENFCFDLEQFEHALITVPDGSVADLDEAFELNVRSSQSRANMRILSLLQQAREKKLFVILILPCIFDLDKNIILSLCDMFIHCYREPFGRRGQYNAYDYDGIKKLWLYGRESRSYSYKISTPTYGGRFTKNFVLDYQEYRKKKISTLRAFRKRDKKKQTSSFIRKVERNKLIRTMYAKDMAVEKIGDMFDIKARAIYNILKRKEDKTKIVEM